MPIKKVKKEKVEEKPLEVKEEKEAVYPKEGDSPLDTQVMNDIIELVYSEFKLPKDAVMLSFKDSGASANLILANRDFEISIKLKDLYKLEIKQYDV